MTIGLEDYLPMKERFWAEIEQLRFEAARYVIEADEASAKGDEQRAETLYRKAIELSPSLAIEPVSSNALRRRTNKTVDDLFEYLREQAHRSR